MDEACDMIDGPRAASAAGCATSRKLRNTWLVTSSLSSRPRPAARRAARASQLEQVRARRLCRAADCDELRDDEYFVSAGRMLLHYDALSMFARALYHLTRWVTI